MKTAIALIKFSITAAAAIVGMLALVVFLLVFSIDGRAKTVVTQTVAPENNIVQAGNVKLALARTAANHDWYGMDKTVVNGDRVVSCRPSLPDECVEITIKAVGGDFQITATGYSKAAGGPLLANTGVAMASKDIVKAAL